MYVSCTPITIASSTASDSASIDVAISQSNRKGANLEDVIAYVYIPQKKSRTGMHAVLVDVHSTIYCTVVHSTWLRNLGSTAMKSSHTDDVVKDKIHKLHSLLRKIITGNEKKRIRDQLRQTQDQPKLVKLFDKIAFTIGVLHLGICQYFLLNRPTYFPVW